MRVATSTMEKELATTIIRVVASVLRRNPEEIRPDASFDDLAIDSLDRINILFELESTAQVALSNSFAFGGLNAVVAFRRSRRFDINSARAF